MAKNQTKNKEVFKYMITAKVYNPLEVKVSITITKDLNWWKAFRDTINDGKFPGFIMRNEISDMITRVEQEFKGEWIEDKK